MALPKYDFETQLPFCPFPSIFAENTHHFAPHKKSIQRFAPYSSNIQSIQVLPNTTTSINTQFHKLAATLQTIQHFPPYSSDIRQTIQVSPNTTTSIQTQFHKLAATLHHRRTPTTLSRLCYSSPQGACTGSSPIWTRPICCTARNTLIGEEPSL
jgi:hypothetical protein